MNTGHKRTQRQRSSRKNWLICLLAGLAVLCFGPYLMSVFPAAGAGYSPQYGSPVFAFEFAQSKTDLLAIFGESDNPAREQRILAMDRGHHLDFIFAVLYSAFLASFFIAAHRVARHCYLLALAAVCAVAGLADIIENNILLGLTQDLEAAANLAYLFIPVQIKFLCLVVAGLGAGYTLLTEQTMNNSKLLWKLFGGVALISSIIVLPGLALPDQYGFLVGNGITVCWLIMLIYAATQVISKRQ